MLYMNFEIESDIQAQLEAAAAEILLTVGSEDRWKDIKTKKPGDVLIEADLFCDRLFSEAAQAAGCRYHSEETYNTSDVQRDGEILVIADPIDGSSEVGRYGPRHTLTTTAALALRGDTVAGGVVGDIWNRNVYGLGAKGLYVYAAAGGKKDVRYLEISETRRKTKLADGCVAAYAPYKMLLDLIYPALYERAQTVSTNAGIGYALMVAEMEAAHAPCASIETKPIDLFEHIGAIMAAHAGAYVCRIDGSPFVSDPRHLQTSITAVSKEFAEEIVACLAPQYEEAEMPHDVICGTPEAERFQKG